jgi:RNA polymerase sigma factor for flagellar operon FliA
LSADVSVEASLSAVLAERNRVIVEQLPYVRLIAQRIHARLPRHIPLEDLINTGVLGLIEALAKYDPRRKVGLKSYAGYRIRGAILDSLRAQDWGSRALRQRGRQLEAAEQQLRARLRRAPSILEVARELGMSESAMHDLINDLHGLIVTSLESAETGAAGTARGEEPQGSEEENPFELCRQSEMNEFLAGAIAGLGPRQRDLLRLYYFRGLNMREVGTCLGVCESRVSQMHAVALAALRRRIQQQLTPRRRPAQRRVPVQPISKAVAERPELRWPARRVTSFGSPRRPRRPPLTSERSAA